MSMVLRHTPAKKISFPPKRERSGPDGYPYLHPSHFRHMAGLRFFGHPVRKSPMALAIPFSDRLLLILDRSIRIISAGSTKSFGMGCSGIVAVDGSSPYLVWMQMCFVAINGCWCIALPVHPFVELSVHISFPYRFILVRPAQGDFCTLIPLTHHARSRTGRSGPYPVGHHTLAYSLAVVVLDSPHNAFFKFSEVLPTLCRPS